MAGKLSPAARRAIHWRSEITSAPTGRDAISKAYAWVLSELTSAADARPAEADRIYRNVAAAIADVARKIPGYKPPL